jgi:peptidoglycan hydrolase CwlO-like protein
VVEDPQTPSRKSLWEFLGPGLSSALVTLLVTGVVWGAVAVRDMARSTADRVTALEQRDSDHEQRLRKQESREPRLGPMADELRKQCAELDDALGKCQERASVIERDIKHLTSEQDRVCQRVLACQTATNRR